MLALRHPVDKSSRTDLGSLTGLSHLGRGAMSSVGDLFHPVYGLNTTESSRVLEIFVFLRRNFSTPRRNFSLDGLFVRAKEGVSAVVI